MRTMHIVKIMTAAVIAFGFIASVAATPIVYTDRDAWLSAVGSYPVATENFESSPVGPLSAGTTDIGIFDVTIDANNGFTRIDDTGWLNGSYELQVHLSDYGVTQMSLGGFDAPVFGFSADWFSTTSNAVLTMEINGTAINFGDYLSGNGTGFLGIVDTASISSIDFGRGRSGKKWDEAFSLDNVTLASDSGSVMANPEPSSLILMGTLSIIGIVFYRRRRH